MYTNSEKSNSMLIHLSALSSYVIPFGSLLLPLVIWQSTKKDSEYIDHHGKEAINFNLSFFIYNIVSVLILVGSVFGTIFSAVQLENSETPAELFGVLFSTGGFLTAIIVLAVIGTVKLIFLIIAAIQANNGKLFRYPLIIRFIK
jgi:uncharacterized Tic20 family protein